MSVSQVVLLLVLPSLAVYGLVALLAAGGTWRTRRTRYRPGDAWTHEPVWWSADPARTARPVGGRGTVEVADDSAGSDGKGGAGGVW